MIGKPERFGVCDAESVEAVEHRCGLPPEVGAERVAAPLVDVEPGEHGRERRDRRRAGVEVRRRRDLQQVLQLGRAGDERRSDEYAFEKPADEHDVVVGLAEVADDAVAAHAVRARLVAAALADHAEAVRVVDVEERVVARARARRSRAGRGRCRSCC